MRISDWSSDVCSSDLFYPGVPVLRTIGRRLLLLIPTLFGLSVLLFFWVRALPGGPAVALLGERATPEAVERINELYGFNRSEEHTSELQSLMRISYAVFCLKKNIIHKKTHTSNKII